MVLSLMSFSFMADAFSQKVNADQLCRIAKSNRIKMLDLMAFEIRLYKLKNLKKALAAHEMSCGCVIDSMPFYQGAKGFEEHLEKSLNLCEKIGAGALMVVPGSMDAKACEKMSREEIMNRAIECFTLAVERGRERGIEILFEDTPQAHKPLSSAADCRKVLDAVPGLGFVFDTANFLVSEPEMDLLSDYELLKDRIRRVHLKDVVRGNFEHGEGCENGESIRCVTTGSGIVPLRPLLQRMKADGYDGVLCVEYAANGVSGSDHVRYLSTYVKNIHAYLENKEIHPPYTTIPSIDKPVSRLFFGTAIRPMLMGQNVDALLDAAMALGMNTFDCARGYGLAEKSLGQWIQKRNNRERVVILSKCGNVNMRGEVCVNRKVILSELDKSLKTLGTDYIDIYLLHRDDPKTPISEFMETLNECKKAGKIRVFGVSNWTHERIAEANRYAAEHDLEGFTVSSPNYGLARQVRDPWGGECVTVSGPENAQAREWYTDNQMPVIAYSSLARGFFSGKFQSFDYEGAKKVLDGAGQKGYLCEENMRRLRNAEEMAETYQTSVADIALRYVFGSSMNTFAVMSTTNPKRLPGNIKASRLPLSKEEITFLEQDQD